MQVSCSSSIDDADTVSSADCSNITSFFVGPAAAFSYSQDSDYDLDLLTSSPTLASSPLFSAAADYGNDEEVDRDYMNTSRYFVDITLQNFVKPESLGARVSSCTKAIQGYGAWTPPRAVSRRPRVNGAEKAQSTSSKDFWADEEPAELKMSKGRLTGDLRTVSMKNAARKSVPDEKSLAIAFQAHAPLPSAKHDVDRASESDPEALRARECRRVAIGRLRVKKASRRFGQTTAIRYHSRKKIAEVRPRVNGRFVRLNCISSGGME